MNESLPAGAGDVDCVKVLLAAHAEVDCKDDGGATALIRAAAAGRADCVKTLLDNGADAKITVDDGKTALEMAVYGKREWSYKGTHQNGALIKFTTIDTVTNGSNADCLKALIAAGADLNAKDKDGNTALSLAKSPDLAAILRTAGATE